MVGAIGKIPLLQVIISARFFLLNFLWQKRHAIGKEKTLFSEILIL